MRVKYSLIILFITLCGLELVAQESILSAIAADTNSSIDQRFLDEHSIANYWLDRDYQYTSGPARGASWWDRLKHQLYENLIRPLFDAGARGASEVLMLLLAIAGVAIMFFFFFKNRKTTTLDKQDLTWGDVFTNPAEIEELQFNQWMKEAESKGDYNEALKFLYLRCIRQMDKKNLLHYRPEYTNRQVINKLKNKDVKEIFGEVSRQFEFVWYGHFTLSSDEYMRLKLLVNKSILSA